MKGRKEEEEGRKRRKEDREKPREERKAEKRISLGKLFLRQQLKPNYLLYG